MSGETGSLLTLLGFQDKGTGLVLAGPNNESELGQEVCVCSSWTGQLEA